MKSICRQGVFLLISWAMGAALPAFGQCKAIPLDTLEQGIYEFNLGDVRLKIETYNQIFKMKLVGAVNEDWTSVNVEQGPGMISGYIGNGPSAKLKAKAVLTINEGNYSASVFKKNALDEEEGIGYFISEAGVKCVETTYSKWEESRQKYISSISAESAINLEPDGFL